MSSEYLISYYYFASYPRRLLTLVGVARVAMEACPLEFLSIIAKMEDALPDFSPA